MKKPNYVKLVARTCATCYFNYGDFCLFRNTRCNEVRGNRANCYVVDNEHYTMVIKAVKKLVKDNQEIDVVLQANEGLRSMQKASFDEIVKLRQWVSDLQSGMYVNCVYCGHRYGPNDGTTPVSMADALKEHIEHCPKHPMSALKAENEELKKKVEDLRSVVSGGARQCVYCGHLFSEIEIKYSKLDILKEHIERCPSHPMSALRAENE